MGEDDGVFWRGVLGAEVRIVIDYRKTDIGEGTLVFGIVVGSVEFLLFVIDSTTIWWKPV